MKQLVIIIGFLLANVLHGQIQIDEPIKDLGDVFEDKGVVKTFFKLENPYRNDTISIVNINTSCGCTAILSEDTIIPPQSSINLTVAYDPKGRIGLFMKTIELETKTGANERNRLYLKITGNVISEKVITNTQQVELLEYKVAPIYFYPITPFDTSYLDFTYITPFINDLTYEIDYFQFVEIGFEIVVDDRKKIEGVEGLLFAMKSKAIREFEKRGFLGNSVTFAEPTFLEGKLPEWAFAEVKFKSQRFNVDEDESTIITSATKKIDESMYLLDYERFSLPEINEVVTELNVKAIEGKLFLNDSLHLIGAIQCPKGKQSKITKKYQENLAKLVFKKLKKATGVNKQNILINFDSLAIHPDNKYRITLWDEEDEELKNNLVYRVQEERITQPFLPTLKQSTLLTTDLDVTSKSFKHFWSNLLIASKQETDLTVILESSISNLPRGGFDNNHLQAQIIADKVAKQLEDKFKKETGKTLHIIKKSFVHGPPATAEYKKRIDFSQFEYIKIIPLTNLRLNYPPKEPKPYSVNFDYYFLGIDTSSWVLNNFIKYLNAEIQRNGFVELRIESSISQIKIERYLSNNYVAYSRLLESQKRLEEQLKRKLIDPNRLIYKDEQVVVQGPPYDRKVPIIKYRKFHYLKIIPENYLKN